jgi:predicted phosphodiesterase
VSLIDELANLQGAGSDIKNSQTPPEWRARLDVGNDGGYFISTPRNAGNVPDAVEMFKDFDLDPNEWVVVSVRKSRWQRFDGEWLEAARVSIKPVESVKNDLSIDFEQLIADVKKWKPTKYTVPQNGKLSAIYAIGDTQYGKDAGDGTEGTVRRVFHAIDESVNRHKELIKIGRDISTVCLPQLGDCIEGSVSQHGKVLNRSDLGITQQVRLGRRVLMNWVKAFAPLSEKLIIPAVPGNHDEVHRIALNDPTDSWQLDIVAAVQDACAENPALAHVEFRYPEKDNSTLAIELSGVIVGMAHGHQSRDAAKWWQGQATGRTPIGSADILLTGHYHHFKAQQVGPRLWLQVPAMDGGSSWFKDRAGLESPTGIISLVVGENYDPRRDLSVLAGERR